MASRRNDIATANDQPEVDESDRPSTANASYRSGDARGWPSSQPEYTETYSVHFTNLSSSETAENLQRIIDQELGFKSVGVSDILMHTPKGMCWICNIKDENVATDLAEKWNLSDAQNGNHRFARVSVREPEYCRGYRTARCTHPRCYFDHVPCTAKDDNPCPRECPLGHKNSIKEENIVIPVDLYQNYRIRILGIPPNLEPEDLSRKLGHRIPNQIIVSKDSVHIVQLKSIKYAKLLVNRLHNRPYIKGHIMKCQLELNVLGDYIWSQSATTRAGDSPQRSPTPNNPVDKGSENSPSIYTTGPPEEVKEMLDSPTGSVGDLIFGSLPDTTNPNETFSKRVSAVRPKPDNNISGSDVAPKGPSGLPPDVPRKWKVCTKSECKGGGEGEVTKICLNTDEKIIAAIKIYNFHTPTRKMRAYREVTALKILSDLTNVSHLYSPDTDPVKNIPDSLHDTLHKSDYATFWAILAFIKGVTMKEFVTQRHSSPRGFSLLDALNFTEKLLSIVKAIQAKGVVHRDLKPDNIMVTFNKYGDPTEDAELFVIDFGQAYIATQETTDIDWSKYQYIDFETGSDRSIGNRWYRVPQLDIQNTDKMTDREKNDLFHVIRRSPTIDASSICAIFFWMFTKIVPEENRDKNNLAPHQKHSVQIFVKIDDAVSSMPGLSDSERNTLKNRLQMYLMTTFDKGFELPERQWTVEQLDYRLKLIRSVFNSPHANTSVHSRTLQDASKRLLKLADAPFSSTPSFNEKKSPLDKAASAFLFAKTKFIENHPHNYKWTDSSCQWMGDVHNMIERKHYDILSYYRFNQSWSILVCCTANINETGSCVLLSIGSIVHGLYIGIPIGQYATGNLRDFDNNDIYSNFELELKNLIHLVCKRKSDAQQ